MPSRIDRLTDAQLDRIPEWVAKWTAIGLSTEPADFDAAAVGVRRCYRAAELPEPGIVLRLGSPLGAAIAWIMLATRDSQVASQVGTQVGSQVDSQVGSQVRKQVYSQVGSQVESQVESQVGSQVESQVESQVGGQVYSQVRKQVHSQVGGQVLRSYRGGNLWASWYAYVSFFRDVCHWDDRLLEAFAADEQHALNASWCIYGDRFAALADRPAELHLQEGRLHNEAGPSITWRDGWQLWHIDGVAVDEQIVIRPETQTLDQIHGEENAEVQRLRIDRYGWPRYLAETGATVVDKQRNDVDGTREALMEARDGQRRLVCSCPSTAKVFAMHVPREITSCEQAQQWLGGNRNVSIIGAS